MSQLRLFEKPFLISCECGAGDEVSTLATAERDGWRCIGVEDMPEQDGFGWTHHGQCPACAQEGK
jgi:hypothetical protein